MLATLDSNIPKELREFFDEYKFRTSNVMRNFAIGLTAKGVIESLAKEHKQELENYILRASTDHDLSATTYFKFEDIVLNVYNGTYINQLSYGALIELCSALDQLMVNLYQYYLPNLSSGKVKNNKILAKCRNKEVIINSKTLIYPYSIYRHCFNSSDAPLLLQPEPICWIRDTIALRHMIIHNNCLFSEDEKQLFITFHSPKESKYIQFNDNAIDDIYHYHSAHVVNFINKLAKHAEINLTEKWNPNSLNIDFTSNKYVCFEQDFHNI